MATERQNWVFDYQVAGEKLSALFQTAEQLFRQGTPPEVPAAVAGAVETLFASKTQSLREVALGCGLVRLLDKSADLNKPYVNQGEGSYNGRSLDEQVVNPFLHDRQVPATKGPYLATFRRSVQFDKPETRSGVRDTTAFDALVAVLAAFSAASKDTDIEALLRYLLFHFVALRDASQVPLAKINRLNLDQYDKLFEELLNTPSGGLLPVLLTVALLKTIAETFNLQWEVPWQGINVADKASGAGGDVTVLENGAVLCAIEVTERPIDRSRVVSTFNTKISPNAISDYLFVFTNNAPANEARAIATQYFGQGHDVNFVGIKSWLVYNLATIGGRGRITFTKIFLSLMDTRDVPASLKVKWNDLVKSLFG